ncbi:kinase-like domain-containing protein [Mycena galopus ATCC 62051]|nr:kinase-like domain-containing protein [Mycena galopus ATCC 62051]
MAAAPARRSEDVHPSEQLTFNPKLDAAARKNNLVDGILSEYEIFWRDRYFWLKDAGYLLRPRYSPSWTPPWKGTDKYMSAFEDSVLLPSASLIDATRVSDGSYVVLKRADKGDSSHVSGAFREAQLFQKFSSEPLASDPKNHCIRLIEILQVPDDPSTDLIVMPLLWSWDGFPFLTIGEAVEFLFQIFEGLQFLHNHNIWHGDCKANNIAMNAAPILREDPHPWSPEMTRDFSRKLRPVRNRTQNPVKYYWIDFDLSDEHDPSKGPPLVNPGYGGIRNVPEWSFEDQKCNPFAVDVWCLGFMVQGYFTEGSDAWHSKKKRGFEFMQELVADMVQEDPAKRPSMDEVVDRFSRIKTGLSPWKLRSQFTSDNSIGILRSTSHWIRQLYFMARRIPAIPTP